MNNKHQELIDEKVAEFTYQDHGHVLGLITFFEQTLQDTIDIVVAEERKVFKEIVNIVDEEFLALPDAEDYIGEWTINVERKRILETLDKTPPDKV